MKAVSFARKVKRRSSDSAHVVVPPREATVGRIQQPADVIPGSKRQPLRIEILHAAEGVAALGTRFFRKARLLPIAAGQSVVTWGIRGAGLENEHSRTSTRESPSTRAST